ncbi:MAG: hypothetical protein AUJ11_00800 [Parcubacteria group bacterium CG1_02_44_65]|nr:MAG: hypothetical protein AUJ11_00800 [Parcubacteria group bacterium CG1_02_44_65]
MYQVKLYVDGSQVGTAVNLATTTATSVSLGNSFIIPAGTTKTLEVKSDIKDSTSSSINKTNNTSIAFQLGNVKSCDYTKQTSGGVDTTGAISGNTLTVRTGTVGVTKNVGLSDRAAAIPTGVVNAPEALLASFIITAGSGEAVDVTQITLQDASAVTQVGDNFQNLLIKNGSTQIGTTIANPSTSGTAATYSFSPSPAIRINAGAQYQVDVYADIKGTVQDSATTLSPVIKVDSVTATGVTTNSDASATSQALSLQNGYIAAAGTLTITTDSDTPVADQLLMGSTDNPVAKFKLTASTAENIEVSEIIVGDTVSSAATGTITNLKLYDGDTAISGPVQFSSSATTTYALARFPVSLTINKGANKVLTVKADVNTAGAGATSASTHTFAMLVINGIASTESVTARGVSSGTSLTVAGANLFYGAATTVDQTGSEFKAYKTKIIVAWASDTPTGASVGSASQLIGKINVTNVANSGAYSSTVELMNVTISSTINNTAVRALKIYKDSVSGTALATTNYVAGTSWGASAITDANFTDTEIASGATKTFFLVLDTSDAANTKALSINIAAAQIEWTDGVTASITDLSSLPLLSKTFTY